MYDCKCSDIDELELLSSLKFRVYNNAHKFKESNYWKYVSRNIDTMKENLWNQLPQGDINHPSSIYRYVLCAIGIGSFEGMYSSSSPSIYQLSAIIALHNHFQFESIYICDPAFTFLDCDLIFEIFANEKVHVEVFSGSDISIPLNKISQFSISYKLPGNFPTRVFLFMPHCDRCVFGMVFYYFLYGDGLNGNISMDQIMLWGNNLFSFLVDTQRNSNTNCEFCNVLKLVLDKIDIINYSNIPDHFENFNYAFHDLGIFGFLNFKDNLFK
ncbi:hypothetical protein cand_005910 [Cryptosporidium andersoni]|uniref:SRR1-like domain-containing protein n=1 Tax=Cryptosporidium andersoni TaxID=117008 RepID=A0A1J4MPL1_9CRYT|nr:hypothetical protein cand_005910 [Cryptosporidium andersoni]